MRVGFVMLVLGDTVRLLITPVKEEGIYGRFYDDMKYSQMWIYNDRLVSRMSREEIRLNEENK